MADRTSCFLFSVALLAGIGTSQAQTTRIVAVEVHGNRSDSDVNLLKGIDLALGRELAPDDPGLNTVCDAVHARLAGARFLHVGCVLIADADGGRHVVIDVVEPVDSARLDYPAMNYGEAARMAESTDERAADPVLACARNCGISADRADAFEQLARRAPRKASCRAALSALDDASRGVRSQSAKLLQQQIQDCARMLGPERLIDASLRQLTRPSHQDRVRAIATLDLLLRTNPDIDATRRQRIEAAAEQLAANSALPATGGRARNLLDHVRGRALQKLDSNPER